MFKKVVKDKRFILLVVAFSLLLLVGAGIIYWRKNRYDPQKYTEYVSAGDTHYESMEYAQALDNYLLAAEVAPREFDAYVGIVTVLGEKGRFDDVKKILEEIDENLMSEEKSELYAMLGDYYLEAMMYEDAQSAHLRAYDLNPTPENAERALESSMKSGSILSDANFYKDVPNDSEVSKTYQAYNEADADDAELYDVVKISQDLLNEGYPHLVVFLLESREKDMTEYWEGKYFLGRAYFDTGDYERSLEQFELAMNLGADDYALYWYMGRASLELGDKEDAYKYYTRAVQFADEDQVRPIVDEYSDLLIEDGRIVDAENLLNQFYDRNWARIGFMKVYHDEDKEDLFLKESGEYNVESEDDQDRLNEYYLLMVDYYLKAGELDMAMQTVEVIAEMDGHQAVAAYYEGLIEKAKGDNEKARTAFMRSIDLDMDNSMTDKAEKELVNLTSGGSSPK